MTDTYLERQIREAATSASDDTLARVARGDTDDKPNAALRRQVAREEIARRERNRREGAADGHASVQAAALQGPATGWPLDVTGRYVEASLHGPAGWCGESRPHTHGLSEGVITYTDGMTWDARPITRPRWLDRAAKDLTGAVRS